MSHPDLPNGWSEKDQALILYEGLDKVEFEYFNKDDGKSVAEKIRFCLEGVYTATAQITKPSQRQVDRTKCAAYSQKIII